MLLLIGNTYQMDKIITAIQENFPNYDLVYVNEIIDSLKKIRRSRGKIVHPPA